MVIVATTTNNSHGDQAANQPKTTIHPPNKTIGRFVPNNNKTEETPSLL
jgi:hypothetical protein